MRAIGLTLGVVCLASPARAQTPLPSRQAAIDSLARTVRRLDEGGLFSGVVLLADGTGRLSA